MLKDALGTPVRGRRTTPTTTDGRLRSSFGVGTALLLSLLWVAVPALAITPPPLGITFQKSFSEGSGVASDYSLTFEPIGNDAFETECDGKIPGGSLPLTVVAPPRSSQDVPPCTGGRGNNSRSWRVIETGPAGFSLQNVVCEANVGEESDPPEVFNINSEDAPENSFELSFIPIEDDESYTCTITNIAPPLAQLTIIKETNPASASNLNFEFAYDGPDDEDGIFSLNGCDPNSTCGGTEDRIELTLPPGDYTITESSSPGNWDLTAITCEPDGQEETSVALPLEVPQVVDPPEIDLTLAANDTVTCTFKNERRPQIRVFKYNDENANGTEDEGELPEEGWEMTLYTVPGEEQVQGPRSTGGTGIANFNSLDPGASYYVCEEQREGWVNTDPDLELGAVIDGLYCQLVENLVYGENREVRFGNVETATIEVTVDANGPPVEFCFTTTDLEPESFCLTDGETQTFEDLLPGQTYVITEEDPPLPWVLTDVSCSESEPQCVIGSISVTPDAGATVTVGTFTFRLSFPDFPGGPPGTGGGQAPVNVPALPLLWLPATAGVAGLLGLMGAWRRRRPL